MGLETAFDLNLVPTPGLPDVVDDDVAVLAAKKRANGEPVPEIGPLKPSMISPHGYQVMDALIRSFDRGSNGTADSSRSEARVDVRRQAMLSFRS